MISKNLKVKKNISKIDKIAILTDEPRLRAWFVRTLIEASEKTNVSFPLIIVLKERDWRRKLHFGGGTFSLEKLFRREILSFIVTSLQTMLGMIPDSTKFVPLKKIAFLGKSKVVFCDPIILEKSTISLNQTILETLKEEKISLLLNRSRCILGGKILSSVPNGVWGFHLGDLKKHRGAGYFLNSYCSQSESVCITLQKLNERVDGGEIIIEKHIKANGVRPYKKFKDYIYNESHDLLVSGIIAANKGKLFFPPKKLGKIYKIPGLSALLFGLFSLIKTEIKLKFNIG